MTPAGAGAVTLRARRIVRLDFTVADLERKGVGCRCRGPLPAFRLVLGGYHWDPWRSAATS